MTNPKMTRSQEVWTEIKDAKIDVFAQVGTLEKYADFMDIDPDKCYIKCKASAALPAMETALGAKFSFTLVKNYVLVEKKPASPF